MATSAGGNRSLDFDAVLSLPKLHFDKLSAALNQRSLVPVQQRKW
jgi:hypothetical protein